MAALFRALGLLRDVVCTRSFFCDFHLQPDHYGKRGPPRNCRLATVQAPAVASGFQSELLFASSSLSVALRSRLEYCCQWAGCNASPQSCTRLLVDDSHCPAANDGNLVLHDLLRCLVCHTDEQSPA